MAGQSVERGLDTLSGLFGDRTQLGPLGDGDHDAWVERLHQSPALGQSTNDDVAREQQTDVTLDAPRAVGELGMARAENEIVLQVLAELALEGAADVNLGQDAKALAGEGFLDLGTAWS